MVLWHNKKLQKKVFLRGKIRKREVKDYISILPMHQCLV